MRKIYLFIFFFGFTETGFSQHSFSFDLYKGDVLLVKSNGKNQTVINSGDKFFSGDKLVIGNNSSWVVFTNEKGASFKLQHKGEFTINSVDAKIVSLNGTAFEKYLEFIKKYFLPETNAAGEKGLGIGGGIDMLNNNDITSPSDNSIYLRGERIILKFRKRNNVKKLRLLFKDPMQGLVLDTLVRYEDSLDITEFTKIKGLQHFNVAVSYDPSVKPAAKSFINISRDNKEQPECLIKLYLDYPEMRNDKTDMALMLKASLLYKNRYYSAADRLRRKVF